MLIVIKKLYFEVIPFRIHIVRLISTCRVNKNYTDYLKKKEETIDIFKRGGMLIQLLLH